MKKIIGLLIIIAAVIGVTFLVKPEQRSAGDVDTPQVRPDEQSVVVEEAYVRYPGEDGKNAFELLQKYAEVEFDEFDFGVFVKSIRGTEPDENHFWKLYVNGEEAQTGAKQIETEEGDVIEWKVEKIEN